MSWSLDAKVEDLLRRSAGPRPGTRNR